MPSTLKKQPTCPYGNPAKYVCINSQCRKPGLICQKAQTTHSECWLFHQNCTKVKWNEIQVFSRQNMLTKTPDFLHLQDKIENLFMKTLQKIQYEHEKFKIWMKTYGHSLQAMKFIKNLMDKNYQVITGDYMANVMPSLFSKEPKRIQTPIIVQTDFLSVKYEIDRILQKISSLYLKSKKVEKPPIYTDYATDSLNASKAGFVSLNTNGPYKDYSKQYVNSYSKATLPVQFRSKILQNLSSVEPYFQGRRIKTAKLVFRASQHNFSIRKFHELCDGMTDTLVLIHNQYGKKIGGYTPVAWTSDKKHWVADKTLKSFIFSVTMNEKFKLNLAQFAIASNPERGPIFGCCDICIVDNSHRQRSNCEFPISYNNNGKYVRSPNTSTLFTGHPKGQFLVREWQVFSLQLQ